MSGTDERYVVVGAGPWGLASAWQLARDGASVTLLDDGEPPAGHVAAGMIGPWSEAEPGRDALFSWLLDAQRDWPAFAAALGEAAGMEPGHHECGALLVAGGREQIGPLRRRREHIAERGRDVRWHSSTELRGIEPGLGTGVAGGLHLPDEHQVDPRRLLAALRAACEGADVRRVAARAVEVVRGEGVRDAAGNEHPGQVVLAAGWRGPELAPAAPVRGVKGQILRLATRSGEPLPCTHVVRGGDVYIVPRPSGEVVVGATMEERTDRDVMAGDVHHLLDEAIRLVPGIRDLRLVETAAAMRPASSDGAPLIGGDGDGVVWATGGFRHGIMLTPIVGPAVRAALAEAPSAPIRAARA